ncbi:hypothetical protein TrLO_g11537 [Triparma laevis f. longispina]|uniref:Uncharacterized protein n=1 Tax=Triparma laevis f. longispina TaxID=1714387 RepID=A0A9W7CFI7_9STRA|nr:hypothetical protein TrLO_g11537 [Triparma laevis f. longispina]
MVNVTLIASTALLVIGVTVAALLVLKAQYDTNSGNYNTIGEICADLADIEEHGDVAMLCKEFGSDGADL